MKSPKGNAWNTISVFSSGQAFVTLEEALFLQEFHKFKLMCAESYKELNNICDIMKFLARDCGLTSYKVGQSIYVNLLYLRLLIIVIQNS